MRKKTKLKKVLNDKGITQTFLASKLGISVKTINDIVNGRTNPKATIMIKIADILEKDIKEII